MNPEVLRERLKNTKTFNYNVYLAESARLSKDCLSHEEALDEILALFSEHTAVVERESRIAELEHLLQDFGIEDNVEPIKKRLNQLRSLI